MVRLFFLPVILGALGIVLDTQNLQAQSKPYVVTRYYGGGRSGANLKETILNTSNVNSSTFGRIFVLPVDDQVYASLLYASGLTVGGAAHNVLYAVTMNNSVYAFDADRPAKPLWMKNFNGTGRPGVSTEVGQYCTPFLDISGNIGILGTPVIDASRNTMYFVTRTGEATGIVQRLHALDITTGLERPNSPVVITASVPGTGEGGSTITFNPLTQNQRPALAFAQGTVYIGWASFCDTTPYHGWMMAYDGTTLSQVGVHNTTPNGMMGGVWMAGAAPAFDASGNLYVSTGNGDWNGTKNFGESLVKLSSKTLGVLDYFTASNYNSLNIEDLDFGSGGPTMVPGTKYVVTGGKEGKVYLIDTTNLGKMVPGDTQIPQVFQAVSTTTVPSATHHIHNANPWWQSPQGLNMYVWGENDYLRGYRFDPTAKRLVTTPFAVGSVLPPLGMPGGMTSISANGSQTGTGIVWATFQRAGDANQTLCPGILYALNAETLATLWSSTGPNDDFYLFSKGSNQIVANGKVYLAGQAKYISVYGLKAHGVAAQNLAYQKPAIGSTPCSGNQTPDKAVNGTYAGGLDDKWCSSDPNPWLTVDLGTAKTISRVVVEHAGGGMEPFEGNTVAFKIDVSTDGVNFTTVQTITNNTLSISTHVLTPVSARYVRLSISKPSTIAGDPARIYELQVF
ncbi:MAG: discoidin domain-containing protein [Bryobacteraceae bacterium]